MSLHPFPKSVSSLRPRWMIAAAVSALSFAGLAGPLAAQEGITNLTPPTSAPAASDSSDYFWWAERFDRVRFSSPAGASHYFLRQPQEADPFCYLPPFPPPLGAEVPIFGSLLPTGPAADVRLAPHINDPFYPMLGSAFSAGQLFRPLQAQLENYQGEKAALQRQLRASLAELKDADAASRERRLSALAGAQAPRFASLESAGEKLRAELQRLYPLGGSRAAHTGTPPPASSAAYIPNRLELESDALLLAAFYQDGLSPDQRRLLREASVELALEGRAQQTGATAETGWLFFSPEMARIRLPAELPATLAKTIAGYQALKDEMKRELRDVLGNSALTGGARTETLKQLAITHAARLAALEALAEDIRRGLAGLPETEGLMATTVLPADLAARISNYRQHKTETLKTLHGMLTSSQKGSISDFNRAQTRLLDELSKENAEIRQAVGNHVRSLGQAGDRKSIDDLLREFENARQHQESQARFRDYRAAVLLPGLSPDQRRVLFDAAITELSLPLPAGQRIR